MTGRSHGSSVPRPGSVVRPQRGSLRTVHGTLSRGSTRSYPGRKGGRVAGSQEGLPRTRTDTPGESGVLEGTPSRPLRRPRVESRWDRDDGPAG